MNPQEQMSTHLHTTRADENSKPYPQSHWELGVYYWENFYSLPYQGRFWFMIEKNFAHFHTQKLVGTTHFHTKRLWLVGRRLIIGTVHKKLSLGASGISLRKCLLNSIPKARWNHSPAYQTTLIGRPKRLFASSWHCSQKALIGNFWFIFEKIFAQFHTHSSSEPLTSIPNDSDWSAEGAVR